MLDASTQSGYQLWGVSVGTNEIWLPARGASKPAYKVAVGRTGCPMLPLGRHDSMSYIRPKPIPLRPFSLYCSSWPRAEPRYPKTRHLNCTRALNRIKKLGQTAQPKQLLRKNQARPREKPALSQAAIGSATMTRSRPDRFAR